jgi:hypothetical protein
LRPAARAPRRLPDRAGVAPADRRRRPSVTTNSGGSGRRQGRHTLFRQISLRARPGAGRSERFSWSAILRRVARRGRQRHRFDQACRLVLAFSLSLHQAPAPTRRSGRRPSRAATRAPEIALAAAAATPRSRQQARPGQGALLGGENQGAVRRTPSVPAARASRMDRRLEDGAADEGGFSSCGLALRRWSGVILATRGARRTVPMWRRPA